MRAQSNPHAFTIADLLGIIATGAVLGALAVAGAGRMRQESQTASGLSQLRWLGGATGSYAADNGDRYWNFSWKTGATPSAFPDLQFASSDLQAAAHQAVDIIRRRGRPDMPAIIGWLPHVQYSHLPLLDYLDRDMPDFNFVSPADEHRLRWARDPAAFDAGAFLPFQPDPAAVNRRWPYSASFEQPAAFYDQSPVGSRISQSGSHTSYLIPPSAALGAVRIADVAHPSQKAHVYVTEQRDRGAKRLYFLDDEKNANVPVLMADGSVLTQAASDANRGWIPNSPTQLVATRLTYSPRPWEAQGTTALGFDGRYRWTRGGIAGRDFGGPEIDTGQP